MEIFAAYGGSDFLIFYGVMLVTVVIAGIFLPRVLRPEGQNSRLAEMEDAAVLAGGKDRLASVITADLLARGGLAEDGRKKLTVRQQGIETGPAGAAVLSKGGSFHLGEIGRALKPHVRTLEADLVRRGLLMDQGERWRLRLIAVAPYTALLLIGIYRYQAGEAAGEPTEFLLGLMMVTLVLAIMRLSSINPRTRAGVEAIDELRGRSERLRSAPTAPEVGIAVAVFGTAVLVGTPFEAVHAMRQSQGGDGADSGGDSDGGDSGCGGGCGGCGG